MSLVTLTDHDTIAGALTLADRPDFFISEEITAVFPENECVMHVLAWNITPGQHEEIQSRRHNIYDLCDYLNRHQIAHALAHPLLSPNWRLDAEVFEKVILLFPTFEAINGLVDRRIEPDLFTILDRLTPDAVAALSRKHGIAPVGPAPSRKALVAGSDDHVHRRCGTVYAELDGALDPTSFLDRCMAGVGRLVGEQAHLNTMAVCIKHTTYHHLKQRGREREGLRNPFVEMMDLIAGREPDRQPGTSLPPFEGFVASMFASLQGTDLVAGPDLDILSVPDRPTEQDDARIVDGVAQLANGVIQGALDALVEGLNEFDLYQLFGACRDLTGALVTAAPVFFAAHHFGRQERQVRRLFSDWDTFSLPNRDERLAVFSDSVEHIDGVSTWCSRFVDRAHADQRVVLVPHCGEPLKGLATGAALHRLPSITSFSLPLYDQLKLYVPSLIDALVWCWSERITHVELATPGPMGLAGLLAAKVLQLPVTASYHTEVPSLIKMLGGPPVVERVVRRYLGWFYGLADRVFAFSSPSRESLRALGVPGERIHLVPQTVDPTEFSPQHRSEDIFHRLNVAAGTRPVILSVGRLSAEKNLPLIIDAVENLQDRPRPPILVVVGDGPSRSHLEKSCVEKDFVYFVGAQHDQALKSLYASADMFVFASQIDTLGLVNMEAMASGIPVLVPADAGISELLTPGVSAELYDFGTEGLVSAIARMLDDPLHAERIGTAGRQAMIARWESASFSGLWKSMVQ
jgi:glycosyltransferase involved in cell wall biosynthesis